MRNSIINNKLLDNKNCFITGASGGLGWELAKHLARNGCNLFLTSKNSNRLKALEKEIRLINPNIKIYSVNGDLNKLNDIKKIIVKAKHQLGPIDILINNAGILTVKFLTDYTIDDFNSSFNVNVRAPFLFCKEFSKDMMKKKWGRIVNIGSSAAYTGSRKSSVYRASKHALLGFSKSIHKDLRNYNIRTFCISPGPIKTKMGKQTISKEDPTQDYDTFIDPKEIADYIVHTISYDDALFSEEVRLHRIIGEA